MPILGIVASSQQSPSIVPNSYESISTVTVTSNVGNIEFSSIPSTYTHLQVRMLATAASGSGNGPVSIQLVLNSDTGANYTWHRLYGSGSGSGSNDQGTSQNNTLSAIANYNSSVNNIYSASVLDIIDYANTNKYKTLTSLGGYDANGSGYISYVSGLWMNTAAISNIKIYPLDNSYNWRQYSSFALYGIKGA